MLGASAEHESLAEENRFLRGDFAETRRFNEVLKGRHRPFAQGKQAIGGEATRSIDKY